MSKIPAFMGSQDLPENDELDSLITSKNLTHQGRIIELNQHNSQIIENLLLSDDSYIDYGYITFDYIRKSKNEFDRNDYMKVLRAIDIVNSTNVWRYDKKSGNKRMNNIVDLISDPLTEFEKRVDQGDIAIVDEIIKASILNSNENGARSFASKVCKYFDEYLKDNPTNYQNNYYIDDYYIRRMLPYYLDFYGVKNFTIKSFGKTYNTNQSTTLISRLQYSDLFDLLEVLRSASNFMLTRSQLDHIIWYCYKSYEQ